MSSADTEYFRARAAAERDLAETASEENVAAIHRLLAAKYQALADQKEFPPSALQEAGVSPGSRSLPA